MTCYTCHDKDAAVTFVEVMPRGTGNRVLVTVKSADEAAGVKAVIEGNGLGQKVISETHQQDGSSVLITEGPKDAKEVLAELTKKFPLELQYKKKTNFNAWGTRAVFGIVGQSLVLASTFMSGKFEPKTAAFAASNLGANLFNIVYGSSKEEDAFRLAHIKQGVNNYLDPVSDGHLPKVGDDITDAFQEHRPLTSLENVNKFFKSYAAQISISLRIFGAFNLLASGLEKEPMLGADGNSVIKNGKERMQPKPFYSLVGQGKFKEAMRNIEAPLLVGAGAGVLTGKAMALSSNSINPFDPKEASWLDKLRSKGFLGGGALELASFGAFAYHNLAEGLKLKGKEATFLEGMTPNPKGALPNFLKATGGLMFVVAYLTRTLAKMEEHVTDIDEVYAHISAGLTHVPKEQLQQLIANTSVMVADHFADKNLSVGEVYNHIAADLYRYHGISLDSATHLPATLPTHEPHANTQMLAKQEPTTPLHSDHIAKRDPIMPREKPDLASAPASFAARAQTPPEASMSLGA